VSPCPTRTHAPAATGRRAFTLIEVLAAMLLIAIVLPAIMGAISLSTRAAAAAKSRTEASMLASGKLSELLATQAWQSGTLSGDFGTDWPNYKWSAVTVAWTGDDSGVSLTEIDLTVSWRGINKDETLVVSTLVPTPQ